MAVFYDAGGGCIAGKCIVKLANHSMKKVEDIKKGD